MSIEQALMSIATMFVFIMLMGGVATALDGTRAASIIGGSLIVILSTACIISYVYSVVYIAPGYPLEYQCLGPPYEVC